MLCNSSSVKGGGGDASMPNVGSSLRWSSDARKQREKALPKAARLVAWDSSGASAASVPSLHSTLAHLTTCVPPHSPLSRGTLSCRSNNLAACGEISAIGTGGAACSSCSRPSVRYVMRYCWTSSNSLVKLASGGAVGACDVVVALAATAPGT